MHERMRVAVAKADQSYEAMKREMLSHGAIAERLARAILNIQKSADYGSLTPEDFSAIQEARQYVYGSTPMARDNVIDLPRSS